MPAKQRHQVIALGALAAGATSVTLAHSAGVLAIAYVRPDDDASGEIQVQVSSTKSDEVTGSTNFYDYGSATTIPVLTQTAFPIPTFTYMHPVMPRTFRIKNTSANDIENLYVELIREIA